MLTLTFLLEGQPPMELSFDLRKLQSIGLSLQPEDYEELETYAENIDKIGAAMTGITRGLCSRLRQLHRVIQGLCNSTGGTVSDLECPDEDHARLVLTFPFGSTAHLRYVYLGDKWHPEKPPAEASQEGE